MKSILARLARGESLGEDDAAAAMRDVMDGEATPAQIGGLLMALATRGETEDEVVGFARAMRERAIGFEAPGAVDNCGTGGDGAGSFNISTVASFVVAACGVPVAKHGNRSASGSVGSADVLEALGLPLDQPVDAARRSFQACGWAFLFAPAFHASTRHAAGPRRELGVRTLFNLLGPLTNPARPEAQVVGVPRRELAPFLARCLGRLGSRRAFVVHGLGLDELALDGPTFVAEWRDGGLHTFELLPEHAGLERSPREALAGGDAAHSARFVESVLSGELGPRREVVLFNAAAALAVAGRASDLREGVALGAEAIDSGAASRVLARAREAHAAHQPPEARP